MASFEVTTEGYEDAGNRSVSEWTFGEYPAMVTVAPIGAAFGLMTC
jgi:hypothetical protein